MALKPTDEQIEALREAVGPTMMWSHQHVATLDVLLAEREANARIVEAAKRWHEWRDKSDRVLLAGSAEDELFDAVEAAGREG